MADKKSFGDDQDRTVIVPNPGGRRPVPAAPPSTPAGGGAGPFAAADAPQSGAQAQAWGVPQGARGAPARPADAGGTAHLAMTGMNVLGAVRIASELGAGKTVVTVACDTGLKYLAGDLFG